MQTRFSVSPRFQPSRAIRKHRRRRPHVFPRHIRRVVGNWSIALVVGLLAPLSWSHPLSQAPAESQNLLFDDTFSQGTVSPFVSFGGHWQATASGLAATDLGLSRQLDRQFAYMSYETPDVWLEATVRINQVPRGQSWRVGLITHDMGPGDVDKWALVLRNGELSLLNENTRWVSSIPFSVKIGVRYQLELVTNGTTVDGMVWRTGTQPPKRWMISGRFAPNRTASASDVGLYAGNVNATFQNFTIFAPPPPMSIVPVDPASIFVHGDRIAYQVEAQNPSMRPRTMRLSYQLRSLTGHGVRRGSFTLLLNATAPVERTLTLPPLANGVYQIIFSLSTTSNPRMVVTRLPGQTLAVIPRPAPPAANPILWGMNDNLATLSGPGSNALLMEHFALMRLQGIDIYRLQIPLPAAGQSFAWARYNRIIRDAAANHIEVLGLLTGPPPGKTHPIHSLEHRYLAFIRAVVRQYRPGGTLAHHLHVPGLGVTHWEIWNEPSTRAFWPASARQYGALLSRSVQAIHRVAPQATVIGYAYRLHSVWSADRVKPNAWAIHYYPGTDGPNNTRYPLTTALKTLHQFLVAHHRPTDIWITETGWSTSQISTKRQAEYLVQAGIDSVSEGVRAVIYFTQTYYGGGYGEQQPNLSPEPSYAALAELTRVLDASQADSTPIHLGPLILAHAFTGPGSRSILTLSSRSRLDMTITAQPGIDIYNAFGAKLSAAGSSIPLTLGNAPVYIVGHGWTPSALEALVRAAPTSWTTPYQLVARLSPHTPTSVTLQIQNLTDRNELGYLTVSLPQGWTTPSPSFWLPSLGAGQIASIRIPLDDARPTTATSLPLTISVTTTTGHAAQLQTTLKLPKATKSTPVKPPSRHP